MHIQRIESTSGHTRNISGALLPQYKVDVLHNHILETVTSAKYIGITLQSSFQWSLHYDNIISNVNKSLDFLKRNLTVSNTDIKSRAYQALARPKLEYSCSVWDPYTNEYKKKIEMVIRRAARFTTNNYHNTSSVNAMIDTLGRPSLARRCRQTPLIMFYKITHCLIAIPTDILVPSDNRLRKHHSQSYQHIQTSKDTYKWSLCNYTMKMLPQHRVQSITIDRVPQYTFLENS